MFDLHREVMDALKTAPEILAGLLQGISQERARSAKGGDENWSIAEVVCHLRDAEEIGLQRTTAMRDQDTPTIVGYDQELLARERDYRHADVHAALSAFSAFREKYIALLASLQPEEWDRAGEHTEVGCITIFSMAVHKSSHDAIHCAQIARQLAGG
jgi:hypothetical protein